MEQRELDTNKKDKGFTLVELLIVIVILGILATVVVFAVRGITDQGQDSACNADKKALEIAIEAYYAQEGTSVEPTEAVLVTDGYLREQSTNYNITAGSGNTDGILDVAGVGECV
jgi:prepilin-type N-terminal cleavage/methylation domain-containing protein